MHHDVLFIVPCKSRDFLSRSKKGKSRHIFVMYYCGPRPRKEHCMLAWSYVLPDICRPIPRRIESFGKIGKTRVFSYKPTICWKNSGFSPKSRVNLGFAFEPEKFLGFRRLGYIYIYTYIPTASNTYFFGGCPKKTGFLKNTWFFYSRHGYEFLRENHGKLRVNYGSKKWKPVFFLRTWLLAKTIKKLGFSCSTRKKVGIGGSRYIYIHKQTCTFCKPTCLPINLESISISSLDIFLSNILYLSVCLSICPPGRLCAYSAYWPSYVYVSKMYM